MWSIFNSINYNEKGDTTSVAIGKVIKEFQRIYELISKLFHPSEGHKHTGKTDDCPQIDTSGLADNSVVTVKIKDGSIIGSKIPNNVIINQHIQDSTIQNSKLANLAIAPASYKIPLRDELGRIQGDITGCAYNIPVGDRGGNIWIA